MTRLEAMLRLLDNEALDEEDPAIDTVKDMLDDYLDRNQEDFEEFEVPDDIYEGIMPQLDGLEVRCPDQLCTACMQMHM